MPRLDALPRIGPLLLVAFAAALSACRPGICERTDDFLDSDVCEVNVSKSDCTKQKGTFSTAPDDGRAQVYCMMQGYPDTNKDAKPGDYHLFARHRLGSCVMPEDGECDPNGRKSSCEKKKGTWTLSDSESERVAACTKAGYGNKVGGTFLHFGACIGPSGAFCADGCVADTLQRSCKGKWIPADGRDGAAAACRQEGYSFNTVGCWRRPQEPAPSDVVPTPTSKPAARGAKSSPSSPSRNTPKSSSPPAF